MLEVIPLQHVQADNFFIRCHILTLSKKDNHYKIISLLYFKRHRETKIFQENSLTGDNLRKKGGKTSLLFVKKKQHTCISFEPYALMVYVQI